MKMISLCIKEILLMAKWMDWEQCTLRRMNHFMKVNGKMIIHMELEEIRMRMHFIFMKVK